MRKITKVPNGPLIKKKGPFKGSTLKAGGKVKKALTGIKATPSSEVEYTKRYSSSKKKYEENEKKGLIPKGINVSKGSATAKPYEKKFIKSDNARTSAMIVDSSGSKVKTATTNKGSDYGNKMLYREYQRDSTDTMNRRNKNANFYNVQTGTKKNLTNSDKKILVDLKKAKK